MPGNSRSDLRGAAGKYGSPFWTIRTEGRGEASLTFIAVESAGCQAHGLSEMDDGFLNTAHVPEGCTLQEQRLHTVAVQLDGLGSQVQGPGVPLTVEAVATDPHKQIHELTKAKKDLDDTHY